MMRACFLWRGIIGVLLRVLLAFYRGSTRVLRGSTERPKMAHFSIYVYYYGFYYWKKEKIRGFSGFLVVAVME